MKDAGSMIVDGLRAVGAYPAVDSTLLTEARIKVRKLREFVQELIDGDDSPEPIASHGLARDYDTLRALVVEVSPRLAPIMPPEIAALPNARGFVTLRELVMFCEQIEAFFDSQAEAERKTFPKIDEGAKLFGPSGLDHDSALLAAARIKTQTLLDFVENNLSPLGRVPVILVEDFNEVLALIRQAAPEAAPLLPRDLPLPLESKPEPEQDHAGPSAGPGFFRFWKKGPRPRTPKYLDFFYHCQKLARLLK